MVHLLAEGEDKKAGEIVRAEIKVEQFVPEGFDLTFADSMAVNFAEDYFIISFFQGGPPIIKTVEELEQYAHGKKAVRAHCKVRIAVTPKHMGELIKVLEGNLKTWAELHAQKAEKE